MVLPRFFLVSYHSHADDSFKWLIIVYVSENVAEESTSFTFRAASSECIDCKAPFQCQASLRILYRLQTLYKFEYDVHKYFL